MAISMEEKKDSRGLSATQDSRDITYTYILYGVSGTTDHADAYTHVRVNTPTIRDGLYRAKIECKPIGGTTWEASVDYSPHVFSETGLGGPSDGSTDPSGGAASSPPVGPLQNLGPDWSFTTGSTTTHITQSLGTLFSVNEQGAAAPNVGQAIGVTEDGVEGTDIITPAPEFTKKARRQNFHFGFYVNLCRTVGKTNRLAVCGGWIKPGELLYLGCEIQYTSDNIWEFTHKFAYNENRLGIKPSDIASNMPALPLFDKKGWDYLWVGYSKAKLAGKVKLRPVEIYVEQVYRDEDFAAVLQCGL